MDSDEEDSSGRKRSKRFNHEELQTLIREVQARHKLLFEDPCGSRNPRFALIHAAWREIAAKVSACSHGTQRSPVQCRRRYSDLKRRGDPDRGETEYAMERKSLKVKMLELFGEEIQSTDFQTGEGPWHGDDTDSRQADSPLTEFSSDDQDHPPSSDRGPLGWMDDVNVGPPAQPYPKPSTSQLNLQPRVEVLRVNVNTPTVNVANTTLPRMNQQPHASSPLVIGQPVGAPLVIGQPVGAPHVIGQPVGAPHVIGQPVGAPHVIGQPVGAPHVIGQPVGAPHVIGQPVGAPHVIGQPVGAPHVIGQPVGAPHVIGQPVGAPHVIGQPVGAPHVIGQPVGAPHVIGQPVGAPHVIGQPHVGAFQVDAPQPGVSTPHATVRQPRVKMTQVRPQVHLSQPYIPQADQSQAYVPHTNQSQAHIPHINQSQASIPQARVQPQTVPPQVSQVTAQIPLIDIQPHIQVQLPPQDLSALVQVHREGYGMLQRELTNMRSSMDRTLLSLLSAINNNLERLASTVERLSGVANTPQTYGAPPP